MKRTLQIRPEAERDLAEALAWHQEQRSGLDHEFILGVEAALETIERYPESDARVHGDTRRALLRRFPYGVFYLVEADRIIVLAVMHASRDPRHWQARK